MPGLPTIYYFRQNLPHSLDVLVTPSPDVNSTNLYRLGCGHLLRCNVL